MKKAAEKKLKEWLKNSEIDDEEEFKRLAEINLQQFKITEKKERNKIINNLLGNMGNVFNKRTNNASADTNRRIQNISVLVHPFRMKLF